MVLDVFGAVMAKLRNVTAAFPWPKTTSPPLLQSRPKQPQKRPPMAPFAGFLPRNAPNCQKRADFSWFLGQNSPPKGPAGHARKNSEKVCITGPDFQKFFVPLSYCVSISYNKKLQSLLSIKRHFQKLSTCGTTR